MPVWLLNIVAGLATPALKILLKAVLRGLESKYPGLAPFVDAVIGFLENGGNAATLHLHCQRLPDFSASELKKD
jgi:hypothetical protein